MKYGYHGLSDPIQQLLEAQEFEPECHGRSAPFRQQGGVNPHPQVPQEQGYGYKYQPQVRIARASVNARLSQLAEARFDAKAFPVALADSGWSPPYPPGCEQQLLLSSFALLAVVIGAVGNTHRDRCFRFAVLQGMP